jgi:hypothetical protein
MGARLLPFTAIPVIDIGALSGNDRTALVSVAREIGEACKTVGFFYIKNHGVPQTLIDRTYAHSESFHRSPAALKERVHVRNSPGSRGDRFQCLTVYIWCALAGAVAEGLVALAPHTAAGFAAIVLVNSAFTGLAYGSVVAVIYDRLESMGAATVSGVLGSLSNLPVLVVTMIIGAVQTRAGSTAMLFTEAGLGVVSIALLTVLVLAWRPRTVDALLQTAAS